MDQVAEVTSSELALPPNSAHSNPTFSVGPAPLASAHLEVER